MVPHQLSYSLQPGKEDVASTKCENNPLEPISSVNMSSLSLNNNHSMNLNNNHTSMMYSLQPNFPLSLSDPSPFFLFNDPNNNNNNSSNLSIGGLSVTSSTN